MSGWATISLVQHDAIKPQTGGPKKPQTGKERQRFFVAQTQTRTIKPQTGGH
jgi:hypothetical protein